MWGRIKVLLNASLANAAVPVVVALVGIVAFAVGATLAWEKGISHPPAAIALWIAQTLLASGIVVAVMRAIQSADYFEDGMRRVLFDPELPPGPINYETAWNMLTTGLIKRRFGRIDAKVNNIEHPGLIGDSGFYYVAHHRTVRIGWGDKSKGLLSISDTVDGEIQTADTGTPVMFENRFKPEADSTRRSSISCTFSGGISRSIADQDMSEDATGRHGFSIELPPSSTVKIKRQFKKVQDLAADPILNYASTGLIVSPRVTISCESGLRFYFRKCGMPRDFRVMGGGDEIDGPLESLNAVYEGLCLRNHGYMIVIVKG